MGTHTFNRRCQYPKKIVKIFFNTGIREILGKGYNTYEVIVIEGLNCRIGREGNNEVIGKHHQIISEMRFIKDTALQRTYV